MLSSWLTRSAASTSSRHKPEKGRVEPYMVRLRRWTRRVFLFSVLMGLLGMGSFIYYRASDFLYTSPYFHIEEVRVLDVPQNLAEELSQVDQIKRLQGRNLLLLDARKVERDLAAVPYLSNVRAVKKYPNRLVIRADERSPVAVLAEDLYLIDRNAVLLEPVEFEAENQNDLPFISGVKIGSAHAGEVVEDAQLPVAIDLLGRIKKMNPPLYEKISEIAVDAKDGLTLFMTGGIEVRLGRRDPVELMAYLEAFLRQKPDLEGPTVVDLRFKDQLVYK